MTNVICKEYFEARHRRLACQNCSWRDQCEKLGFKPDDTERFVRAAASHPGLDATEVQSERTFELA